MHFTLTAFFEELKGFGWVQWLAFLSGVLYIVYASKDKVICWLWGILSSSLWAYASFFQLKLFSDSILQIIYIGMGIWGWYRWYHKNNSQIVNITTLNSRGWLISIVTSTLVSIILTYFMSKTKAAFPAMDAFLTVFSINATILLIQKKIENWWWWIVIDLINIPVFIIRGGHLFALLFIIYTILAIKGLFEWNKKLNLATSFQ
ncbi:MAG: nicotinamide riboside transporter PnuC [Saprospiraceae bacterium]